MRVFSVLAVNNQVARAIIRKLHVALWPKRLDNPALVHIKIDTIWSLSTLSNLVFLFLKPITVLNRQDN